MKLVAYIFRFLLGAVFIFSGFVKAIDPFGFAYKISDYFAAFNLQWMDSFALFISISMSALEFLIGAALFLGITNKLSAWLGLLFMAFFTPLTLYLAVKNPVSDCGCFGDAFIMTNWETFYKNVALIIFAIITFVYRNKFKKLFSCRLELIFVALLLIIPVGVSIFGMRHEPVIDFRPWKVGNSMKISGDTEDKYFVIYKNKETGETKEYLSPNFPWDDPEWVEKWEFVDQRIEASPFPEAYIFIGDENGHDYFKSFTQQQEFLFMLIMHDLEKTNLKNIEKIKTFAEASFEKNIDFIALTGSTPKEVADFTAKHEIPFEFFFSDDITLKTIVRSNPGLMLIKDGVILAKWGHRDIPEFNKIDFEKLALKYIGNE
jgi:uncharacterized membrane protein YphA (DoxX/SURF4 family)